MPRRNPDYSKGLIYTIRTGDCVYVGSTTDFRRRKSQHKSSLKKGHLKKLYEVIRNNDLSWDMNPYKLFPCISKLELEIEEERVRVELNADLNVKKCRLTDEEVKEFKKKCQKDWRSRNIEKTKNYDKNRIRIRDKEYDRNYYQTHKEIIISRSKKYYDNHTEAILSKQKIYYDNHKKKSVKGFEDENEK